MQNVGQAAVPPAAVYEIDLTIDGTSENGDTYDLQLGPGERHSARFGGDWSWNCSPPSDQVVVCADYYYELDELDETNNCLTETWPCDTSPPEITANPEVSEVDPWSAVVSWSTSEPAQSLVSYGAVAWAHPDSLGSAPLVTDHELMLEDLEPSTTYHFVVESEDESGNVVQSGEFFFETAPLDDHEEPYITGMTVVGQHLPIEFAASAKDDETSVERVEFALDGQLMLLDYSPPYQAHVYPEYLGLDATELFKPHVAEVTPYDWFGNHATEGMDWDATEPGQCDGAEASLEFLHPHWGYEIYTDSLGSMEDLYIEVESMEFDGISIRLGPRGMPHMTSREEKWILVEPLTFTLDGLPITPTLLGPAWNNDLALSYDYDPARLPVGTHVLRADGLTNGDCRIMDTVEFEVKVGEPDVGVVRTVTRQGSHFDVELLLVNRGTGAATINVFTDTLVGFQPVFYPTAHFSPTRTLYGPSNRQALIEFVPLGGAGALNPGESVALEYKVAPILYAGLDGYGMGEVAIEYLGSSGELLRDQLMRPAAWVEVPLEPDPVLLDQAVDDAFEAADFLLVTNPNYLFTLFRRNAVDHLLATMADLATLRNGVLAYHYGYHVLETPFVAGDAIAGGSVMSELSVSDEIMVADFDGGLIHVHNLTEELVEHPNPPRTHTFAAGDQFAVANVRARNNGFNGRDTRANARDELIVAEAATGEVTAH